MITRRRLLAGATGGVAALAAPAVVGKARPRVAIVGGGFGGATCARYLNAYDPSVHVTLIDPATRFVSCPMSNRVVAGQLPPEAITFPLDAVADAHVAAHALAVDAEQRLVVTEQGAVPYDRVVLSPGIEFVHDAIDGAPEASSMRGGEASRPWRYATRSATCARAGSSPSPCRTTPTAARPAPTNAPRWWPNT